MALINCPECNGQVSDRAPVCPHCGFPLNAVAESAGAAAPAAAATATATSAAPSMDTESHFEPGEPWRLRLAGRPVPVAMLLFWGGMVVGVIFKFWLPEVPEGAEAPAWRAVPWAMIWLGVLWFAVTEFAGLLRARARRRRNASA
jgi:hypothetical protein